MFKRNTLTKENGLCQLAQSYIHVLIFCKTSRKYRDKLRYLFRRFDIVCNHANDKGIPIPVDEDVNCEGKYTDCWDVFIPSPFIPEIIRDHCDTLDMDYDKPIVGMQKLFHLRIPRGMGKLSPMGEGNTRLNSLVHDTGIVSPNDKNVGVVHGRISVKIQGKTGFKTKKLGNYLIIERGKGIGKRGRRFIYVDRSKQ